MFSKYSNKLPRDCSVLYPSDFENENNFEVGK